MNPSSQDFRQFAEQMAQDAGKIMRNYYSLGMEKGWKGDRTPVTKADLEINALLLERVRTTFPEHSVRAEEESAQNAGSEYCWVCDPVDGTTPFSHGIPVCTFSLALVRNGESILGVVYDPFGERLFIGQKGQGSTLNGRPIHVSETDTLERAICNIESHHSHPYKVYALVEYLSEQKMAAVFRFMSSIYPAALVAAGEFAFTVMPADTAHDAAAVKVIVEEAGGRVTDLFGDEQRYDQPIKGMIASNGVLHDQLVQLVKQYVRHH